MKKQLTPDKQSIDAALWLSMRDGNPGSFSCLFKRYYSDLIKYGITFGVCSSRVKDCIQDVFADLWVYRHNLDEEVVVRAYLLSSVRRRLLKCEPKSTIFKKLKSSNTLDLLRSRGTNVSSIEEDYFDVKIKRLTKFIDKLPPRQREALYLRYYEGMKVDHIAQILGVNNQSVSNILHRSIVLLRAEFVKQSAIVPVILTSMI